MLVRHVIAVIVRAVDVRVLVGVAHGDVDKRDGKLRAQLGDEADGLGHIRFQAALAHAEAVRVGEAVVCVQAAGEEEIAGDRGLRGAIRVFEEARAVFIAAAVFAGTGIGAEQFAGEIAVAAFNVHAVETGLLTQARRYAERFFEAAQLFVREDAGRGQRGILQRRAVVGDHRIGNAGGLGIAAAVRRLHDENGRVAVFTQAGLADIVGETLEFVEVIFAQIQLMRACAPFGHRRHRFEPDQPRAGLRKALVAADGQRAGRAGFCAVRALHGLEGDAVGRGFRADGKRLIQRGNILGKRKKSVRFRRGAPYVLQRGVMERLIGHGNILLAFLIYI